MGALREEETETEETEMATWPVWVKPNFSKRIMGRESEVMVRVLISAVVEERMESRKKRSNGIFVIFGKFVAAVATVGVVVTVVWTGYEVSG